MTADELIEKSKQLLSIESTSENPDDLHSAIDLVANALGANPDITVEHFNSGNKPSFLAYPDNERPSKFDVLFNAHVDVVPGKPSQFKPVTKDGMLYGRGAADMKVAAIVMASVFSEMAASLPFKLGLQVVSDEEVGGEHGTSYQIEQGVTSSFVLAGEDTPAGSICTAMCGICWVEVTVSGKSAHGGYLWLGENAILKGYEFLDKLMRHYPVPTEDVWQTTVNVAAMETPGAVINRVPDTVTLLLDIRYTPNDANFRDQTSVEQFFKSLDASAVIKVKRFEPSHEIDPTNPYLQALASASTKVTGQRPAFVRRHGAADVRYFSARGIAAATMGLPDNHTHADGEYVDMSAIESYHKTLKSFLQNLIKNQTSHPRKRSQV